VAVCASTVQQESPKIGFDGSNGAIIAWEDKRSGSTYNIYAQKLNSAGNIQWDSDGVPICIANGDQSKIQMCTDGSEGAIIVWHDKRAGNWDIYVQRINSTGDIPWEDKNGTVICSASSDQIYPSICSDGIGGAIISWFDKRSGNFDIYAQRINASGEIMWTSGGVPISTARNNQEHPKIYCDGSGGAVITWEDYRNDEWDIYAQKINAHGSPQWASGGIDICKANGTQSEPQVFCNSTGYMFVVWEDSRGDDKDIYVAVNVQGTEADLLLEFLILITTPIEHYYLGLDSKTWLNVTFVVNIALAVTLVSLIILLKKK